MYPFRPLGSVPKIFIMPWFVFRKGTFVSKEVIPRSGFYVAKPLQQLAVGDETRAKRVRGTYGNGSTPLWSRDSGDTNHEAHMASSRRILQVGWSKNFPNAQCYIKQQKDHHNDQTFEEEYLKFLKMCNAQYDERYVFDELGITVAAVAAP